MNALSYPACSAHASSGVRWATVAEKLALHTVINTAVAVFSWRVAHKNLKASSTVTQTPLACYLLTVSSENQSLRLESCNEKSMGLQWSYASPSGITRGNHLCSGFLKCTIFAPWRPSSLILYQACIQSFCSSLQKVSKKLAPALT